MEDLKNIDTFLLDMDGTIYLSDRLIDGAHDFLREIERQGKRYIFLTNNSSKNRFDYVNKLKSMGVEASPEMIFTSGEAAAIYLAAIYQKKSRQKKSRVFLLGTPSLEKEFAGAGFEPIKSGGHGIDFVLLGFDTTLTYEKIWAACDYIRGGAKFYATHPDINCPLADGKFMPDTGAMLKMFEASCGAKAEIIGKPHRPMIESVIKKYGLRKESLCMVGDRIETDVLLAKNGGFASVLVLSGATSAKDYEKSEIKADYTFDSVKDLWELLKG